MNLIPMGIRNLIPSGICCCAIYNLKLRNLIPSGIKNLMLRNSKFDLVFKRSALLSLSPHKRTVFCPLCFFPAAGSEAATGETLKHTLYVILI